MHNQLKLLLSGRIITNLADSFYLIAAVWYVSVTSGSPLLVGVTGAVATLPAVLSFIQGPLIDRYEKRTILVSAMLVQAACTGAMMSAFFAGQLSVPLLLVLLFTALMASSIMSPTENTLIRKWTEKDELTRVNSWFSFSYQTVDIIGDALAGVVVAVVGVGIIFGANAVVLGGIGVLFIVYMKRDRIRENTSAASFLVNYRRDFADGFRYVSRQRTLLSVFAGIIIMNVSGAMGLAMIPAFAKAPEEYGFWLMATSAGALTGTLLSSKLKHLPVQRLFPLLGFGIGAAWIAAFSVSLPVVPFVLFALAWIGIGMFGVYLPTMIQVNIPEEKLGIGFSFLFSFLASLTPLAFLAGGVLGEWIGPGAVLLVSGSGYLLFSVYMLVHPRMRRLENKVEESFVS
ncbi:MFS transporter [Alteribacter natronophilus]|uniref:MFS transporter n=1 Tax=Alteribacter natronophilus TaxID=2583810 RepID=UPI00110DDD27|nr:MFS transporter [Alteribacter natronophilus]TMW70991.1 MFS transporter [Alteribacter natronophilus]